MELLNTNKIKRVGWAYPPTIFTRWASTSTLPRLDTGLKSWTMPIHMNQSWSLALGTVGLYVAANLAQAGAARAKKLPGRRALLTWAPIAAMSLVSLWGNHAEIAIGILFGTSVAMLSLVIGATALAGPVTPAPKNWRRIWPFALLAAVMVFLVGLHGPVVHFTGALTLAVEGLIVVALWNAPAGKEAVAAAGAAGEAKDGWPWLAGAAATLLAGAAAIWTMHGKLEFMEFSSRIPPATTAATLLSAALVLPAMRRGRELSRTKQSWLAVTSGVGVVLLNLCALLPLVAMWPYAAAKWPQVTRHGQTMWPKVLWHWHANPAQLLAFPYTVWRVDAVALILLSLLILPTAAEKWDLDGEEGFVLVAGYCAYLVVVMGVTLF